MAASWNGGTLPDAAVSSASSDHIRMAVKPIKVGRIARFPREPDRDHRHHDRQCTAHDPLAGAHNQQRPQPRGEQDDTSVNRRCDGDIDCNQNRILGGKAPRAASMKIGNTAT